MNGIYNAHPLIGQVVRSVTLSQDRAELTFVTDDSRIIATTYGDCCSDTWIENVENEEALIGHAVVSVEDVDLIGVGNVGTPNHPEVDQVAYYGTNITTDAGVCSIDFRNDSNGYYGGDLRWATRGGVA